MCASHAPESLYEHAGGEEGLHRLEQTFYDSVLRDPLLQPLFGEGRASHVEHLTWFTAESFGGPDRFSRELGFWHLISVHRGLKISEAQRRRFVELYMAALDDAGMPDDEPFRTAVRETGHVATHVAMQNSNAAIDEELHPLREVPSWRCARRGGPRARLACDEQGVRRAGRHPLRLRARDRARHDDPPVAGGREVPQVERRLRRRPRDAHRGVRAAERPRVRERGPRVTPRVDHDRGPRGGRRARRGHGDDERGDTDRDRGDQRGEERVGAARSARPVDEEVSGRSRHT